jgi:hypothetical protein
LSADQITAQNKEKIDPDPTEPMPAVRKREAKDAGVVNDDDYDGDRAKKIETGLALAILKSRINSEPEGRYSLSGGLTNGRNVAGS